MSRSETEDFRAYLSRVRPVFYRLFNLAHAVTGSCDQAEYCVLSAMLECRDAGNVSSHGLRENLRACVINTAWKTVLAETPAEFDWTAPAPADGNPVSTLISKESPQTQRMLILKYGCGLSFRRIARLCETDPRSVRSALTRFEARTRRKLSIPSRQACTARILRAVDASMDLPSTDAPDIGSTFRSFQADASNLPQSGRLPARILRTLILLVLAALCMAAFWLAAVLLQPAVLVDDAVPAAEETVP